MRINSDNKSMDMEARDINYILPAYVRSYTFYSKNEMPLKIIFPMFPSIRVGSVEIPIEYVPPLDAIAVEIAKDGSNIAEVSPEEEAKIDEKDKEIKRLKAEVESLTTIERGEDEVGGQQSTEVDGTQKKAKEPVPEPESPAKAAFKVDPNPAHQPKPDRKPGQPPGGDIGAGMPLSDMHPRDRRDQVRTARDLVEEPEIDESEEKEFNKAVSRDDKGRPVVEDKPNE